MVRLILIRHGECVGQGAYIGRRTDPPLSDQGRRDVVQLRNLLKAGSIIPEDRPVTFYVSPMLRAAETMNILTEGRDSKDDIITVADLAEIDFGKWDGMSWDEITAAEPEAYRKWTADPLNYGAPQGESLGEFSGRVELAFNGIIGRLKGGDAVIVSHGGVIRAAICSLLGLPVQSHWSFGVSCASCSIIQLFPDGESFSGAVLESLNRRSIG